jgi:N-acetylglutamate synthase-like GNAT family acetyltransferase
VSTHALARAAGGSGAIERRRPAFPGDSWRATDRGEASPRRRDGEAPDITFREGNPGDARILFELITANLEAGHLLPREHDDLTLHASRFSVAEDGERRVIGCAELAPLSRVVAEVRSLVVAGGSRGAGLGAALIRDVRMRARRAGYSTLCAFAHQPGVFVRLGFSIVPHVWLPEKIATDCHTCPLFRRCGQIAMVCGLDEH